MDPRKQLLNKYTDYSADCEEFVENEAVIHDQLHVNNIAEHDYSDRIQNKRYKDKKMEKLPNMDFNLLSQGLSKKEDRADLLRNQPNKKALIVVKDDFLRFSL
jgi:hypothetical protein